MLDSLDILIGFALVYTVVSLLVTIVVQLIASLANLRGQNLSWAVAETFEAITPELAATTRGLGKRMADRLLKDPILSDKQMFNYVGTATAVRPKELFELLYRIATGRKQIAEKELREGAIRLFERLGVPPEQLARPDVPSARAALAPLDQLANHLPDGMAKDAAVAALGEAARGIAEVEKSAVAAVEVAQKRLNEAYQQFESWLNTSQERAQEWFTMHARIITFVVGAVFAFFLQLDTIEIFKSISTNRALRNQLVSQSSAVLGQAERILAPSERGLSAALATWKRELSNSRTEVKTAIATVTAEPTDTRGLFIRRAEAALAPVATQEESRQALARLDRLVDDQAKADIASALADYRMARGDLDNTGFLLFPPDTGRWREKGWFDFEVIKEHFWGILFSVFLLSLGAPFWFNLLKSLSSLRSSVATNIAAEEKAGKERSTDPDAGKPPPTVRA